MCCGNNGKAFTCSCSRVLRQSSNTSQALPQTHVFLAEKEASLYKKDELEHKPSHKQNNDPGSDRSNLSSNFIKTQSKVIEKTHHRKFNGTVCLAVC